VANGIGADCKATLHRVVEKGQQTRMIANGSTHGGTTESSLGTILLIEDDPATVSLIQLGVRDLGLSVVVAEDGLRGIELAESTDCDLILLDLSLPKITGTDVCRRVRACGVEVPILVISVSDDILDKVVALEIGADDYITKPLDLRELTARINAHLRRQRRGSAQIRPGRMKFPGLIIDVGRHEVLCDGGVVDLTPTEFNLLALLADSAGRVVSRQQMIDKIWGSEHDLDVRSVDAHVYRLRRKIEPERGQPLYIHAVPGVGYTFDPRGRRSS
jgi:DNA-binding response OmpR family regulator